MTEKLFAEWMARDMGDAFIENIVLEKNIDGTYSQGMTRIKFNAFCAGLQSLPVITGEPGAYMFRTADGDEIGGLAPLPSKRELPEIGQQGAEVIPLYTNPQPLQPITAEDVSMDMIDAYVTASSPHMTYPKTIAAAYNAVIKHRGDTK